MKVRRRMEFNLGCCDLLCGSFKMYCSILECNKIYLSGYFFQCRMPQLGHRMVYVLVGRELSPFVWPLWVKKVVLSLPHMFTTVPQHLVS